MDDDLLGRAEADDRVHLSGNPPSKATTTRPKNLKIMHQFLSNRRKVRQSFFFDNPRTIWRLSSYIMEVFDDIERVSATLRTLAGGHEPHRGQIEAVESLVIYQEDTILVAATGYGKSAVLFAFSALKPDKITVQIVPLVTLGESQREDIATKLPESRPIWIDADTHLKVRWNACP